MASAGVVLAETVGVKNSHLSLLSHTRHTCHAGHTVTNLQVTALPADFSGTLGLESSYPLIMAAFATWTSDKAKAAKLFNKVIHWSIRALMAGRLGGSVAEKAFSEAAKKVSKGELKNQDEVRTALSALIITDAEFREDFRLYGKVTPPRAKYLLAMCERAHRSKVGQSLDGLPDWASRTVTLEHLMPRAAAKLDPDKTGYVETLGNMALLERTLNKDLEDKAFEEKTSTYAESVFEVTALLKDQGTWAPVDVDARANLLAGLAPSAWPL